MLWVQNNNYKEKNTFSSNSVLARIVPKLVGHFIQIKKCPWDNIGVVAGIIARGKILKQTNRHINIQSSSICNLGLKQNGKLACRGGRIQSSSLRGGRKTAEGIGWKDLFLPTTLWNEHLSRGKFHKTTSECWQKISGTQKGSPLSSKGGKKKYKR